MKFFSLSFFLLFSTAYYLRAQFTDAQLLEKEIAYTRSKMDSVPWFISSGEAKPSGYQCDIAEHREYMVEGIGFYFSATALNIEKKKKEAYIRIYALDNLAIAFYNNKDYIRSTTCWQEALAIAAANSFFYEDLHRIRPSLNNNFFLAGDYTNAMRISSGGLSGSVHIKDTNRIVHFSNVLGYIHMKQRNFSQAGQYFSQQLYLSQAMEDTLEKAHAFYNLADLALAVKRYDSAISYLQQSVLVYRSYSRTGFFSLKDREACIANKKAEAYKLKGEDDSALQFVLIAVNTARDDHVPVNAYDKASFYINAGDIYNRLHKPDSAILLLRTGGAIAEKIIHREYLRDASEQLAIAFAQKRMFDSAYFFQTVFSRLKDSIASETNQQEIMQRELGLKIQQQEIVQKAALERQKLWRNIIMGIAVFSIITLGFLYNRYRLRQKNRYQQQLNRQQNELFNAIAATQDDERKRIAKDIHDSLGSVLSAAKLKLSSARECQPSLSEEQLEIIQVTMQLLDEASAELRSISHNIMPATLSKLGLIAALRNLVNTISSHSGLQVNFSAYGFAGRLDEKTEMSVYRIVLELINNIVKHAQAEKVTVQLIKHPGYINLSVEDNGRGFDYELELQNNTGIGLANILSRVEYLEGKMNVDAAAGRGTAVIIDIPCTAE